MLRLVVPLLLAAGVSLAADADFNGRWDIKIPADVHNSRVWWLQITGAGTPELKGRFVGFSGGDTNDIGEPRIESGVLTFTNAGHGSVKQQYTAHLEGAKLIGEMHSDKETVHFTGVRAPEISERDDGSWHPRKPIQLFDGKDLAGWHGLNPSHKLGWSVENGILKSTGAADNLVSDRKFWNFDLHVEFKMYPDSNSGVGLRGRYEVQILDDFGKPPNLHSNGSLYSRIAPSVNASKPAGEWQTYEIRLVGRDVTVVLNGQKVIDKGHIDGLTAIAFDADEGLAGPIALQGDHGPVDFRSIRITQLAR
jgi:hypothetical protein